LDNDGNWVCCLSKGNFVYLEAIRKILAEVVLHRPEAKSIPVLICHRTRTQQVETRLEIRLPLQNGIVFALPQAAGSNSDEISSQNLSLSTDEDRSNWPDVILECQWPSLVHESRIPGTHIVRRRPWVLHHKGLGAVYNVVIRRIDLGEYEAA